MTTARASKSNYWPSVYISVDSENTSFMAEVFYVPFPRFEGEQMMSGLVSDQKAQMAEAFAVAEEVCKRIEADQRRDLNCERIKKIFNRAWEAKQCLVSQS